MRRIVLAVIMLAAGLAQAGTSYKAVTTVEEGGKSAREVSAVEAVFDGARARMTFTQSDRPGAESGSYLLTRDGGQTVYMVNPAEKQYMEWDMGQVAGMAGSAVAAMGGLVNMTVTDHEVKKTLDEKGPELLGLPTRHLTFVTRYTMQMSVFGFKQTTSVVSEQELWVTEKIDAAAMALWAKATTFKTGLEDLDKLIAGEMDKVKGFPLKSVTVMETTDQKGRRQSSTTVMEVTELKSAAAPAALFEIPAGYTRATLDAGGNGDMPEDGAENGETPRPSGAPNLNSLMKMFKR